MEIVVPEIAGRELSSSGITMYMELAGKESAGKQIAGEGIASKEIASMEITGKESAHKEVAGKEITSKEKTSKEIAGVKNKKIVTMVFFLLVILDFMCLHMEM